MLSAQFTKMEHSVGCFNYGLTGYARKLRKREGYNN